MTTDARLDVPISAETAFRRALDAARISGKLRGELLALHLDALREAEAAAEARCLSPDLADHLRATIVDAVTIARAEAVRECAAEVGDAYSAKARAAGDAASQARVAIVMRREVPHSLFVAASDALFERVEEMSRADTLPADHPDRPHGPYLAMSSPTPIAAALVRARDAGIAVRREGDE